MDENNTVKFKAGETIIEKGQETTAAYMILNGRVRVCLKNDDKYVELAQLGEDEIFGETAIFDGSAYGANVEALEDTELFVITPEYLNETMKGVDPIVRALLRMMSERLKETNRKLLESETREYIEISWI